GQVWTFPIKQKTAQFFTLLFRKLSPKRTLLQEPLPIFRRHGPQLLDSPPHHLSSHRGHHHPPFDEGSDHVLLLGRKASVELKTLLEHLLLIRCELLEAPGRIAELLAFFRAHAFQLLVSFSQLFTLLRRHLLPLPVILLPFLIALGLCSGLGE